MKNFQCYVGEHSENSFTFSNGINFIIGNNGAGKSKLYDAFYWVLNDHIFNSDTRRFLPTDSYKERLISDHVTRNCPVGETVTCEVVLQVTSASDSEYRLTRIFHATKISDAPKWLCERSKLIIEEKKTLRWFPSSESAESVLKRVIPAHLKPYMWFQGEQVDGLMDLTDKNALTQIINLLSDIDKYDDLITILEGGSEKAATDLRNEQKRLSKNAVKSQELTDRYNSKRAFIENKKSEVKTLESNVEQSKIRIEELISKIGDAKKHSELKTVKEKLEFDLKKSQEKYDSLYKGISSNIFSKYWVLKGTELGISKFSAKFKDYVVQHQSRISAIKGSSLRLPLNVPQPVHVQQMLEECHCFVCDRSAPFGTEAYENIKKHLDRNTVVESDVFVNDFSEYYQSVYDSGISFSKFISNVSDSIADYFRQLEDCRRDIGDYKEKIENLNLQFEGLIDADDSENIVKDFRVNTKNNELYSGRLTSAVQELNNAQMDLDKISKELLGLVAGEIEKKYELANSVFRNLFEMSKSVRDDVYRSIIKDLESDANSIFSKMTYYNNSLTGKISLKILSNGTCIPEIIDSHGYIISGSNDSNIILIKLSLIIAILSSKSKWSENYTLISDAPTAKMAKNYSTGFYEALTSNFNQSIIMTYDFMEPSERVDILNNKKIKIGSIHLLNPSFNNSDREDRADLRIEVTKVSV